MKKPPSLGKKRYCDEIVHKIKLFPITYALLAEVDEACS